MSATLSFVTPPPGLAPFTEFSLDDIDGALGLYALRAVAGDELRLFVLDAARYAGGYAPTLTDDQCAMLGVTGPDEAFVLVVANPGVSGTTVNLMAPIVVNSRTGVSAQLILEEQDWPLRAELSSRSA